MVRITGDRRHSDRLSRMSGPEKVAFVGKALFKAGNVIQTEAQLSITRGAVSGKGHVASAPGQPPMNDTSVLANNIETTQEAPLRVKVSSNAPYAIPLELGSSRMAARPYLKPAAAKKRHEVTAFVREAIRRATGA